MVKIGTIELPGFADLIARLEMLPEEVQQKVSYEMEASCQTIVRTAKQLAPKNLGRLVGLVSYRKISTLNFEIVSAANYSSFLEFGTKSNVRIPEAFRQFAELYQGVDLGGGMTMKDAIYRWAKDKGIDKKWWWWIYKKIQQQGISPQPFFVPALVELPKLEKRIEKIINRFAA